ncbi:MAG: hypothetical protein U9R19_18930 [Bacteroidota bacterium]|nr:hypothetical protein [Bacteroidota bacterium]
MSEDQYKKADAEKPKMDLDGSDGLHNPHGLHGLDGLDDPHDSHVETHGRASLQSTEQSPEQSPEQSTEPVFIRKPKSISSFVGGIT